MNAALYDTIKIREDPFALMKQPKKMRSSVEGARDTVASSPSDPVDGKVNGVAQGRYLVNRAKPNRPPTKDYY
jgi:hypothetical protein